MKSLQNNLYYQILTLRLEIMKNNKRESNYIKKHGYVEEAKKYSRLVKDLNKKLDAIEKEVSAEYQSLKLTSENLFTIESLSSLLLEFKCFDETILPKIERKIIELTTTKEQAIKNYDFKTANIAREEARQLQKYYNRNKSYLAK